MALIILALMAVRLSPTADAFFYGCAAAVLMLLWLLDYRLGAWLAYAASGLLGFLLLGAPTALPFILAYAPWVFVKLHAEYFAYRRGWPPLRAWLLKLPLAGLAAAGLYYFAGRLLLGAAFAALEARLGAWARLWPLGLLLLILLYDLALSAAKGLLGRWILPLLKA